MRYRVKRNCTIIYGSLNKVCLTFNVGQIWESEFEPSKKFIFPYHKLKRHNVLIEVTNEDFEKIFEPWESEDQ